MLKIVRIDKFILIGFMGSKMNSKTVSRRRVDSVSLIRIMDKGAGSLLCHMLGILGKKREIPKEIKKIALIKFFGFGNVIMISPFFKLLKQIFPNAKLILLTLTGNKKLASFYKTIDKVIDINLSNPVLIPSKILNAIDKLRNEDIDVIIDFEQYSRTSAIISFLSNARFGVGFSLDKNPRCLLYDKTIECNENEHMIKQFHKLVSIITTKRNEDIELEKIEYTNNDIKFVDNLINGVMRKIVVLHVGNGPNAPEKRWPTERFVELAKRLDDRKLRIAIIGSDQDKKEVEIFKSKFNSEYIDVYNRLTIPQLAYFLTKANVFVSADTGPAHLAASVDVPSVVLYGPSTPTIYGSWGKNVHHLYTNLWCSPCGTNKNSHEYICINRIYQKCMLDISVNKVEKMVLEIMK